MRTAFQRRCDEAWRDNPDLDLKLSVHILRRREELQAHELSYVYVIHDPASDLIKIGRAKNPKNRISSIQSGCPNPLDTVAVVPAAPSLETLLHKFLAADRVRGEWFRTSPAVLVAIELLMSAGDYHADAAAAGDSPDSELTLDVMCGMAERFLEAVEQAA